MPTTDGKTGSNTPEHDDSAQTLRPEWSTLALLLAGFTVISALTLLAILSGGEADATDETGGTVAYGPGDLTQVAWDEPLLPAVLEANEQARPGTFLVPPAPFEFEGIFPCSECHADMEVDSERRELGFHDEIALDHGPEERWCLDCHNADDRDRLRLATGGLVEFDESYRLCGQCHGTIYRDWKEGIHGRRRGFWNGAKSYLLCAHCHDPHAPRFAALEPVPPPVRPEFLRTSGAEP